MKQNIYTIGETVYDILFKEGKPVSGTPGGAMLNSAVSLGRMNMPVYFISEFGTDSLGAEAEKLLNDNSVHLDFISRYANGLTALAVASLDQDNNATYSFYKKYPKVRFQVAVPSFSENDIVLFGSSFSLSEEVREKLKLLIKNADVAGSIIIYDPNVRSSFVNENIHFTENFKSNISVSAILRCSVEDIENACNICDMNLFYKTYMTDQQILISTDGAKNVNLISKKISKQYSVPRINPISTVGAGDSFNAGIIFTLHQMSIRKKDLEYVTEKQWDRIISNGIDFASNVCSRFENYISKDFAAKFQLES